jgi:hypothetical protein
VPALFRNFDLALAHLVYLEAIRGVCRPRRREPGLVRRREPAGAIACPPLGVAGRFSLNPPDAFVDHHILEVSIDERFEVGRPGSTVFPARTRGSNRCSRRTGMTR